MKKIYLASDHAGFSLKNKVISTYTGYNITDLGCYETNNCDYPDYANKLAEIIVKDSNALGILICGTGIGMSIAANRHSHIRAALCHNIISAQLAKDHNDANVLVLGARICDDKLNLQIIDKFLSTPFSGKDKHLNRINKLT